MPTNSSPPPPQPTRWSRSIRTMFSFDQSQRARTVRPSGEKPKANLAIGPASRSCYDLLEPTHPIPTASTSRVHSNTTAPSSGSSSSVTEFGAHMSPSRSYSPVNVPHERRQTTPRQSHYSPPSSEPPQMRSSKSASSLHHSYKRDRDPSRFSMWAGTSSRDVPPVPNLPSSARAYNQLTGLTVTIPPYPASGAPSSSTSSLSSTSPSPSPYVSTPTSPLPTQVETPLSSSTPRNSHYRPSTATNDGREHRARKIATPIGPRPRTAPNGTRASVSTMVHSSSFPSNQGRIQRKPVPPLAIAPHQPPTHEAYATMYPHYHPELDDDPEESFVPSPPPSPQRSNSSRGSPRSSLLSNDTVVIESRAESPSSRRAAHRATLLNPPENRLLSSAQLMFGAIHKTRTDVSRLPIGPLPSFAASSPTPGRSMTSSPLPPPSPRYPRSPSYAQTSTPRSASSPETDYGYERYGYEESVVEDFDEEMYYEQPHVRAHSHSHVQQQQQQRLPYAGFSTSIARARSSTNQTSMSQGYHHDQVYATR